MIYVAICNATAWRVYINEAGLLNARVMKLVNIGDLKSLAERLVGSSPTTGTNFISI